MIDRALRLADSDSATRNVGAQLDLAVYADGDQIGD